MTPLDVLITAAQLLGKPASVCEIVDGEKKKMMPPKAPQSHFSAPAVCTISAAAYKPFYVRLCTDKRASVFTSYTEASSL